MNADDVPDSTDWLPTPLRDLAAVENALRCQMCKDFYDTPMITSCNHTFCSLCIRRALTTESKCPLCRASEQEMKLRSNWAMEEVVEAFKRARAATLGLAQRGTEELKDSSKRKSDAETQGSGEEPREPKRVRTSARLSRHRTASAVQYETTDIDDQLIPDENFDDSHLRDESDNDYAPEPDDGLVSCPSCRERMKEWQVFRHLEMCPGPRKPETKAPRGDGLVYLGTTRKTSSTLERLPALNYSMLKDQFLRKKMAELGLHSGGSRQALEKRHREWVNLWNANCDSARPKSRHTLFRELDAWERAQNGGYMSSASTHAQIAIKSKDFDGSAWTSKHNDSFKDLIDAARKSREKAQQEETEQPPDSGAAVTGPPTRDQAPTVKQTSEPSSIGGKDHAGTSPTEAQAIPTPALLSDPPRELSPKPWRPWPKFDHDPAMTIDSEIGPTPTPYADPHETPSSGVIMHEAPAMRSDGYRIPDLQTPPNATPN